MATMTASGILLSLCTLHVIYCIVARGGAVCMRSESVFISGGKTASPDFQSSIIRLPTPLSAVINTLCLMFNPHTNKTITTLCGFRWI